MLTLIFPKDTLTSASIPVRWCVDDEALNKVTADQLIPYVIFRVTYESGHSPYFKLFQLDQFSGYLDIHHPGEITIQAFLVHTTHNNKDAIYKVLMADDYRAEPLYAFNRYVTFINRHNKEIRHIISTFDTSEEHVFDIDSELFGKELPAWVKFYVNRYWYRDKPKDECDQRRRLMLFPFTTMIPVFVEFCVRWLYNLYCCITMLSFLYKPSINYLLHPFDCPFHKDDIDYMPSFFKWFSNLPSKYCDSIIIWVGLVPFIPIVYLISIGIVMLTMDYTLLQALYAGPGWLWILMLVVSVVGTVIFVAYNFIFIDKKVPVFFKDVVNKICDKASNALDKWADWLDSRAYANVQHKRDLLLCYEKDGKCLPELSFKDKSAKLIFADIKNKVCRPMRG